MPNEPFYRSSLTTVYQGDFRVFLEELPANGVVITDPPYNIGFRYDVHDDKMPDDDYIAMLAALKRFSSVAVIQYPVETIRYVAPALGTPDAVAAWCYNANIPKRFRLISFYGREPDYSRVKVPYKNLKDRRIKTLLENGRQGAALYEWWNDIQLVKNVSHESGGHPCPIPERLAKRLIVLLCQPGDIIVDPFAGNLTVLKAAQDLGYKSIGCEKSKAYILAGLKRLTAPPLF